QRSIRRAAAREDRAVSRAASESRVGLLDVVRLGELQPLLGCGEEQQARRSAAADSLGYEGLRRNADAHRAAHSRAMVADGEFSRAPRRDAGFIANFEAHADRLRRD